MGTHTYTHTHTHTHTYTNTHTHTHTNTNTHTHISQIYQFWNLENFPIFCDECIHQTRTHAHTHTKTSIDLGCEVRGPTGGASVRNSQLPHGISRLSDGCTKLATVKSQRSN